MGKLNEDGASINEIEDSESDDLDDKQSETLGNGEETKIEDMLSEETKGIESVKKKLNIKIIIGAIVAVLVIAGIYFFSRGESFDDLAAEEIIEAMRENKKIDERIENYVVYKTKKEDPNELLGDKEQYISKASFKDVETDTYEGDEVNVTIEVFNNEEDAALRLKRMDLTYEAMEKLYPAEEYGDLIITVLPNITKGYTAQVGNAVLRITAQCSKEVADQYIKEFEKVLKDKSYSQRELSSKKSKERVNTLKTNAEEYWESAREEIHSAMDELITAIDEEIAAISISLDEKELGQLKVDFDFVNIGYYKDYIEGWRNSIDDIQIRIDEKNAAIAAEKERKDALARGKHSAGMYKVGTDIPAGEYVLIGSGYFSINKDSAGTLDSIIANDNFDGNSIISVSDGQYLEVKRAVFYDINLNPEISTSGPGMFKVGLHIPAGEYKLISTGTGTTSGYVEISSNALHKLGGIIMNDNFKGERYITLKEGQYVKLTRCKIQQ